MMGAADAGSNEQDEMRKEEEEAERTREAQNKMYFDSLTGSREKALEIARSMRFELFITGVIIFNVVIMAMEFYDQPYIYTKVT